MKRLDVSNNQLAMVEAETPTSWGLQHPAFWVTPILFTHYLLRSRRLSNVLILLMQYTSHMNIISKIVRHGDRLGAKVAVGGKLSSLCSDSVGHRCESSTCNLTPYTGSRYTTVHV